MSSNVVSPSVKRPPRIRVAPSAASTRGDLAADFAAACGLAPDDWQRLVLDDWLAVEDGRWASLTCGLSVPRQNGKNGALEVRELFGMVGRGEKFLHTAHEVKTARKHFTRLKHFFGKKVDDPGARFPELNAMVVELRNVNGQEAIVLNNGGSVEIVARSQGSGRGFTVDVIVCDEAQDMSDDDLEALLSTSSAAPSGNPQWIYTGTPPGPKASGEVFTRVRDEALSGKSKRHSWLEWSCEPDADLDSHEEWRRSNPALGTRLLFEVVEGERSNLSGEGFGRERLGMWPTETADSIVPNWADLADPDSRIVSHHCLALDVSPDRRWAAFGAAGRRSDGWLHVEMVECRPGTGWVFEVAVGASKKRGLPIRIQKGSPAASFIDVLREASVDVVEVTPSEYAEACGQILDATAAGAVRHPSNAVSPGGSPFLAAAVRGARLRSSGDVNVWARRSSKVNITPLVAVTLALGGVPAATNDRVPLMATT